MTTIILDPCNLVVMKTSDGGAISITNIEGLPNNLNLLLPLGMETLKTLKEELDKILALAQLVTNQHQVLTGRRDQS
jgi:hypothetical protein